MDLGQVEVIKGVSSALYGAGAMAGVVNLISRRPKDEPVYDVLFNATSLGGADGVAFLSGKLGERWGASFLGGGHFQQRRDLDGDEWADLAEYRRGVARPRLYYDNGGGRSGFLTGGVTYENRDGGRPSVEGQRESLDTRRYDLGGSYQFLVSGKYVFAMRGSTSSQDHDHLFGDTRERDLHRTYFGELSARGTNGRNTWVAGLAADRDEYRPRDFPQFAYTFTSPGIFLQDDIDIAPWLSLSASARADFHSEYGTFFSPRLSALLRGGGWTSRASVGQGFFAPTPLTEETEAAGLARLAIPTPLRAERGRSASFDVSRAVGPVSLSWTAFTSRVRDPIYVRRDTRYELVNLDTDTENAGMEALAVFRKAPFSATASYTYVRSRETVDGLRADVPLTPRHSFGFVGMWEREEWGRVGVESYYTGSQRLEQNPYRDASRRYWIAGVLIEKKLGPVRLFFNMENLTNVRQTRWDPLVRPTRAVDGRWTVDAWAPLDGRVFNGGVRARF
jgi:iron complex outermembrane receptor protein